MAITETYAALVFMLAAIALAVVLLNMALKKLISVRFRSKLRQSSRIIAAKEACVMLAAESHVVVKDKMPYLRDKKELYWIVPRSEIIEIVESGGYMQVTGYFIHDDDAYLLESSAVETVVERYDCKYATETLNALGPVRW